MSKFRDTEDANYVHVRNILRMFLKAIKTPGKLWPASGPYQGIELTLQWPQTLSWTWLEDEYHLSLLMKSSRNF
jgi:hypothetical protein